MVNYLKTIKIKDNNVYVEIPNQLYMAIIRIQGKENLSFEEACKVAGKLVDPRRNDFEKAVKVEVERRRKSELMTQVNKSKKTIGDKKFDEGMILGIKLGKEHYKFTCENCGKEITLNDKVWEYAKKYLSNEIVHEKC